jgi:hypothetical protein
MLSPYIRTIGRFPSARPVSCPQTVRFGGAPQRPETVLDPTFPFESEHRSEPASTGVTSRLHPSSKLNAGKLRPHGARDAGRQRGRATA